MIQSTGSRIAQLEGAPHQGTGASAQVIISALFLPKEGTPHLLYEEGKSKGNMQIWVNLEIRL